MMLKMWIDEREVTELVEPKQTGETMRETELI